MLLRQRLGEYQVGQQQRHRLPRRRHLQNSPAWLPAADACIGRRGGVERSPIVETTMADHSCGCGTEKRDEGEHGDLADERGHRLEHQHRVHVQMLQAMHACVSVNKTSAQLGQSNPFSVTSYVASK